MLRPFMKPINEIQDAHDILWAIQDGKPDIGLDPTVLKSVGLSLNVLCWVLNHNHNNAFKDNIESLISTAAEQGYTLQNIPEV